MLGLYVSSHPLDGAESLLERNRDYSIAEILDGSGSGSVRIAGIITSLTKKVTKNGDVWALIGVEDHDAAIEVACFPNTYQLYSPVLTEDTVVALTGKIRKQETSEGNVTVSVSAEQFEVLDVSAAQHGVPFIVSMPVTRCVPSVVEQLREVLLTHQGETEVHLRLRGNRRTTVVRLDDKLRVTASPALHADLKHLLGPSCIAS
jgi:DNA polymerase III subunit alpha